MSIIKDTFSMPDELVIGSTTLQQREHLDTSNIAKILVIGETGSGKSTYINYLTNYFSRGSLENLRVAIPSKFHLHVTESYPYCEHDIQNSTQSKTYACNQYMFTSNGKQYLFLDTPGLSDTRGAEQDDENIVKIIDSVENLGGLTAVIIVVNGSVSRLTVNLRNVIARLRGNLPDIVMSNVILVLTNTTRYAANFSISALELSGNIYPYYMQNSAFSQDPLKWTAPVLEALQHDWDQAMDEIRAMLHTIDSFKMNSVVAFKQMKEIRNEIKTQMHVARLKVMEIQKMQDEIATFEAVLTQSNADLVTYQDYTKEREVDKIEIVDAPFHSTLCQNCNHVCHPNCSLDEITTVGTKIFKQCSVMSKGNCQQCMHKCSYKVHYHAKKTVQITKQKLQDVLTDIKVMYDQAAKYKYDYQQKITSTADAKKMLEKALSQKNEDIKESCIALRRLCSGFNIAQELYSFIDQLEVESAMLRNIEAKQQTNAFIRSLKEFCNMMAKDQDLDQNKQTKMTIINTEHPVKGQAPLSKIESTNNTKSITQENSNAHPNFEPSPDSDSHATDDVRRTIREICEKKTRARLNKVEETNPFKDLTIQELLDQYHTCTDQRMRNFIVHEMTQRSHGKSVGLLLKSPESWVEFTASTQKYCALGADELNQEYQRLKSQVAAITEPDILNIDQVQPALLIEIGAVYILLHRPHPDDEPSGYNFSHHPIVNGHAHNDHIRFPNHPQHQATFVFNPQSNRPPHRYPYHDDERQHESIHKNEPLSYDKQQQSAQFGQSIEVVSRSSSSSNVLNAFDNMHLSADHRDNVEDNHDTEEVRRMNNTQLLAAYDDAYNKHNHAKSNNLYNELHRRCYGDYPMLMHEKRKVFEQICKLYQGRSVDELKHLQLDIRQKIGVFLTDDDATHINDIPTEYIVEAGVLTHLIDAASSHS